MSTAVQNGKPAQKRSPFAHNMLPKKKQCSRPIDNPQGDIKQSGPCFDTMQYVDAVWQRQKCNLLGLQYCRANRFASGSVDSTLTLPSVIRDTA